MKIAHAMMIVQVIKIAHVMRVVQVMKIVHIIMVIQVMKIAHALIVVQVMKTARAMKAIKKVINGRAGHEGCTDYAGEKVMRLGPGLEDSFRAACQAIHKQLAFLYRSTCSSLVRFVVVPTAPDAHFLPQLCLEQTLRRTGQRRFLPGRENEATALGAVGGRLVDQWSAE